MDKKVEKFKKDYSKIDARVETFKKKQCELKKEIKRLKREAKSIADAAYNLYNRGLNTMYIKAEGSAIDWKPKFRGLINMLDDLEHIMCIDDRIQQSLDEEAMVKA